MLFSKDSPEMVSIVEMDKLYHAFSLLEKLKSGKWTLYIDRSEDIHDWEYTWSDKYVRWWDICHSMTWGYLSAYKELLPEITPTSDDGTIYVLRATPREISIMEKRIQDKIYEVKISKERNITQEFLKKISTKWWYFSGDVLKEWIPSIPDFIPLLYENCYDIEMYFSYMQDWTDKYEVSINLSYKFRETKTVATISQYLLYNEDSNWIILRGKRISMFPAEVDLLRVFIDEGKSALKISIIAESIAHKVNMDGAQMKVAKKNYIYNVRAGLNKNLESIFWDWEALYMIGRNGILHFRFPEFIKKK